MSPGVYDVGYEGMHKFMDLATIGGFVLALCITLLVKRGGILWLAVLCNSFGAFAAASHCGRSPANPNGNAAAKHLNLIAARRDDCWGEQIV